MDVYLIDTIEINFIVQLLISNCYLGKRRKKCVRNFVSLSTLENRPVKFGPNQIVMICNLRSYVIFDRNVSVLIKYIKH